MEKFNVIVFNFNSQKMEYYDVIPYLVDRYEEFKDKPKTFEEFKAFVISNAQYQWWGRCQYEIILSSWPPKEDCEEKWDVFRQVMMNIDVITKLVMNSIEK